MKMWSQYIYIIRSDLRRYSSSRVSKNAFKCYLLHPGFRFSVWFRLHQVALSAKVWRPLRQFFTLMVCWQANKTGIQINPGAKVGEGLYMPHFGGIVVNPAVMIGKNCYLSHNVLIGKVHAGHRTGVPSIGNDVFIGAGAVILGDVKIGNNAAIGANSVVIDDVPDDAFVAGAPAKIVRSGGGAKLLLGTSKQVL